MQIRVEQKNDITIINLNGKLFLESLSDVLREWEQVIAGHPRVVAINCAKLASIDSSSIGTLVRFFNEAASREIELVFYDLNPSIRKLFFTIHLEKFFQVMTGKKFETDYLKKACPTAS